MNDSQKNVLSWISKLKRNIFVMFKNLYCDNITTTTALVWQTEFEIDTHFTPCFYVYTLPISMRSRKKYRIISSRDTTQSSSIIITVSQWELTADAITPSTLMYSSIHARSTCRLYHVNRAAILGTISWHLVMKSSGSNSFGDWAHVGGIYGYPISKWFGITWLGER